MHSYPLRYSRLDASDGVVHVMGERGRIATWRGEGQARAAPVVEHHSAPPTLARLVADPLAVPLVATTCRTRCMHGSSSLAWAREETHSYHLEQAGWGKRQAARENTDCVIVSSYAAWPLVAQKTCMPAAGQTITKGK